LKELDAPPGLVVVEELRESRKRRGEAQDESENPHQYSPP